MLPGFVYKGPDNPAFPATVTAANNGTSLNGTTVELGNAAGGNAATLLDPREIPFAGQSLTFHDNANDDFILFQPGAGFMAIARTSTNAAVIFTTLSGIQLTFAANVVPLSLQFIDTSGTVGSLTFGPWVPSGNYAFTKGGQTFLDQDSSGNRMLWGFSQSAPAALVHIGPVAGFDLPPLIIESDPLTVTIVENAIENDSGNLNFTVGGVRHILAKTLTATAALNFPNTAAQSSSDLTIALAGAADGDVVALGVPIASLAADSCYTAFVSAANTVTVRFNNYSAGAIDPAPGTFRVSVLKY